MEEYRKKKYIVWNREYGYPLKLALIKNQLVLNRYFTDFNSVLAFSIFCLRPAL